MSKTIVFVGPAGSGKSSTMDVIYNYFCDNNLLSCCKFAENFDDKNNFQFLNNLIAANHKFTHNKDPVNAIELMHCVDRLNFYYDSILDKYMLCNENLIFLDCPIGVKHIYNASYYPELYDFKIDISNPDSILRYSDYISDYFYCALLNTVLSRGINNSYFIFLDLSPDVCINRIINRRRGEEDKYLNHNMHMCCHGYSKIILPKLREILDENHLIVIDRVLDFSTILDLIISDICLLGWISNI